MTLRIPAKVLLHVWSYDFYDMTLSTGKQRRHMINMSYGHSGIQFKWLDINDYATGFIFKSNFFGELPSYNFQTFIFSNFHTCIFLQDFEKMEKLAVEGLSTLTGELAGTYYPLNGMDKATQTKMIEDHFLFRADDS